MALTVATQTTQAPSLQLINTAEEARKVALKLSTPTNWQDERLAQLEAIPAEKRTVNNLRAMWRIYCHKGETAKAQEVREAIEALGYTPRGTDQPGSYRGGF